MTGAPYRRNAIPAQLRWWEESPPPAPFACADCGLDSHAASVVDPARCADCARAHYAWRPVLFGKVRKVPPVVAARWE